MVVPLALTTLGVEAVLRVMVFGDPQRKGARQPRSRRGKSSTKTSTLGDDSSVPCSGDYSIPPSSVELTSTAAESVVSTSGSTTLGSSMDFQGAEAAAQGGAMQVWAA